MDAVTNLSENLRYLMKMHGHDSQGALHRASGVSQAHIGNILRGEKSPGLHILHSLATTFKIEPWQLIAPPEILKQGITPELSSLMGFYADSDPDGKRTILRVAESQVRFQIVER